MFETLRDALSNISEEDAAESRRLAAEAREETKAFIAKLDAQVERNVAKYRAQREAAKAAIEAANPSTWTRIKNWFWRKQ
jgi:hypothetical protein